MSVVLPRLLDRRQIAAELNVNLSTAERLMRRCPKVWIGRRVFVDAAEVEAFLKRETKT